MKRLGAAALLLCLALASAPAQAGVTTTNRSHILPNNGRSGGLPQPSLPDFREPGIRMQVILRRSAGLGRLGGANARLSRACREGQFRQAIDRRYVAVLDGKIYGAAVGRSRSLVDRQRLANPGLIYIFVGQGTTSCRVYVGGTGRG